MLKNLNIALLKGGPGSEREVSLVSAKAVAQALHDAGAHSVVEVDVTGDEFVLPPKVSIAFNVIHGTYGEDGGLQRELERRGVSYTGAGVASSGRAFDKLLSKECFVRDGVPTAAYQVLPLPAKASEVMLPLPVCVKPPRQGSSVGVHLVHDAAQLQAALDDCAQYDSSALIESLIVGKELTVGILDGVALPVVQIQPVEGFYDMNNKYPWMNNAGKTEYFCPADLPEEVTAAVQAAALAAHQSVGAEVYSRVDVLLDAKNRPYVLEVNTIPGMTGSSLLPKAARAAGIEFAELCARIVQLSLDIER